MKLIKPEPLVMGGRAHYTLSSYEPVSVKIDVPFLSEAEMDFMATLAMNEELDGEKLPEGATEEELREAVYDEVRAANEGMLEEQKVTQCLQELSKRLMQQVPTAQVQRAREVVVQTFRLSLGDEGLTEGEFLAQTGMRRSDLEAMFDAQAEQSAEQEAAIDAWADHFGIAVIDDELPEYLGAPSEVDGAELLSQIRALGQLEEARSMARRNKAIEDVVNTCHCTYYHETPAEAAARLERMQRELTFMQRSNEPADDDRPHLKLV